MSKKDKKEVPCKAKLDIDRIKRLEEEVKFSIIFYKYIFHI